MQAVGRLFGRDRVQNGERPPDEPPIDPSTLTITGRAAIWSAQHRSWVTGAALLTVVLAIVASSQFDTVELTENGEGESSTAADLLDDRFDSPAEKSPPTEQLVFSNPQLDAGTAEYQATVESLVTKLRSMPEVESVDSYYDNDDPGMLSADGTVVLARVIIDTIDESGAEPQRVSSRSRIDAIVDAVKEASEEVDGFEIAIGGNTSINKQVDELMEAGFARIMMITMILGLVILIIAFRAVVAAVIPLTMAIASIITATAVAGGISHLYALSSEYSEMILLMGMAVGIDYSLFIVSRFRSERKAGRSKINAIGIASSTTGRAVLYAGITVVLSLAGLGMTFNPVFISLGLGAIIVVLLAIIASLTLLPALLGILGDSINRLRLPFIGRDRGTNDGGILSAIADRVMAKPAIFATVAALGLVVLALPAFSLNLGFNSGSHAVPMEAESRRAVELLEDHFTAGLMAPAIVVVDAVDVTGDEVQDAVSKMVDSVGADPAFFAPFDVRVNTAGDLLMVRVPLVGGIDDAEAEQAVKNLRTNIIPPAFEGVSVDVYVTGQTAGSLDFRNHMIKTAPYVFAFVLGLAFILLLLMFRSLIIPVKAIVLNLLSAGAAYGVLVIVFQWGWGVTWFGAEATGVIEAWLPLFLFGILFGLSMDYHMLLLNRIKEAYDHGLGNDASVSVGIKVTASQITSAAAIMVGVFGAFAFGPQIGLQQFGLGLGVAVLIDATVIRTVLLPASMKLLGDWNWYLPAWLEWIPKLGDAEGQPVPSPATRLNLGDQVGQLAPAIIPIEDDL